MAYMKPAVPPVTDSRINARLDAHAAAQLHYLTATTGLGISEVVRASLAHYYQAQRAQQTPALRHLLPLVGRYRSGRTDTSAQVKQVVARHLEAKRAAGASKPARGRKVAR